MSNSKKVAMAVSIVYTLAYLAHVGHMWSYVMAMVGLLCLALAYGFSKTTDPTEAITCNLTGCSNPVDKEGDGCTECWEDSVPHYEYEAVSAKSVDEEIRERTDQINKEIKRHERMMDDCEDTMDFDWQRRAAYQSAERQIDSLQKEQEKLMTSCSHSKFHPFCENFTVSPVHGSVMVCDICDCLFSKE